jgi:hypothetical protein
MKPDFLYLGPDKSGSTWLYEVLKQHPECYVAPCKDIYYFDKYYDRGLEWYEAFFKDAPENARAIGELSHGYLFCEQAVERIGNDLPDITLLATLRNPVERCFSHYLYLLSSGLVTGTFEEVLKNRPGVIRSSLYSEPVSMYLSRFGKEQLHIFLFDDLKNNPKSFAVKVFDVLGLSETGHINYQKKVRAARKARSHFAARLAKQAAIFARDMGYAELVGSVKRGPLARMLYSDYKSGNKPVMSEDTRRYLTDLFRPDVLELEKILGIGLSHWLVSTS